MSGWRQTTLGEVVTLQRGHDLTEEQRTPGLIPVIGSAGQNGWHNVARAEGPGVTVGRSGASAGVVTFVREAYWPHNTALYVRDFKGNDPLFVANLMRMLPLAELNSGSAQPSLNRNFLYPIPVSLPPLDVQRRIASILGAYDDLIEVNRRRVTLLEDMARGLFEEWFVRFRFPGHETSAMVDTPDGPLPHGWRWATLSDMCSRITDGAHRSPASVPGGRLMASVRDMREWGFDYSACRTIAEDEYDELVRNDCQPRPGDILIAKDGANLNKHTFLITKIESVVILSSIAIIRPILGMQKEFMVALLRSEGTSNGIKAMRSGAAIPRIVLKDFKRLVTMLPAAEIREAFDRAVAPIHQLCRSLADANRCLAISRDLLLPRLISGQLSVAAAERELLEAA